MKMKRYCTEVVKSFIEKGMVLIEEVNGIHLFNLDSFRPFNPNPHYYKEKVELYVGNGVTMIFIFGDVIMFEKDGNIISFLACEFLEDVSNGQTLF